MLGTVVGDVYGSCYEKSCTSACALPALGVASLIAACLYHGGDSDTIAAVAGVLGEALWGVPTGLMLNVMPYLDPRVLEMLGRLYGRIEGPRPG